MSLVRRIILLLMSWALIYYALNGHVGSALWFTLLAAIVMTVEMSSVRD